MTDGTNGNQRVTNAMLKKDLEYLIKGQDEMKRAVAANTEHRIACNERWEQHDKEHASLNAKKWAGDIGAAIAGAVTGVAAAIMKS